MAVFDPKKTEKALAELLKEAAPELERSGKADLDFRKIKGTEHAYAVKKEGKITVVEYTTLASGARGAGAVLAGITAKEKSPLKTLGIMLDCSRGRVMRPEKIKDWFRKLALMGYNFVMLYTEDTYELPGYGFKGYLRGGYTLKELQDLDAYAAKLGIELAGCIQTLGHMEQTIRYQDARLPNDTARVLLVRNEKTMKFIDNAVRFFSKALRSRRIHVGMDETHDLGRGTALDRYGYQDPVKLFNEHLAAVNAICRKHCMTAMIWSDMFFRLSSPKHEYYDLSPVPARIRRNIPKDVTLCYWDYYHNEEKGYLDMIAAHRKLGFEPVVASGIWTWCRSWCDAVTSERTAYPCVKACYRAKVKELFFTMWGDDGAYCLYDSAMTELAVMASAAYGDFDPAYRSAKKRFEALTNCRFDDYRIPGAWEAPQEIAGKKMQQPSLMTLLWDDILNGIAYAVIKHWEGPVLETSEKSISSVIRKLSAAEKAGRCDTLLLITKALAEAALAKLRLRGALEKAYDEKDLSRLKKIADKEIPETIALLEKWLSLFRVEWLANCRPAGLDTIQNRTNSTIGRLKEAQQRISEYLEGDNEALYELEHRKEGELHFPIHWYRFYATVSLSC